MEWTFWLAFLLCAYAYFGYPALLMLTGRGKRSSQTAARTLPSVTLMIPACNEAAVLDAKLINTAALNYPADRLSIVIVSDGSTDDTLAIAQRHASARDNVKVIELAERGGKARALNAGLAESSSEILVFSDASILFDSDAIVALVRRFADPSIGCVSGEDRIAAGDGTVQAEGAYGRYELFLRKLESRFGCIAGASGSIYAQRRELVPTFEEGVAPDFMSVLVCLEAGYQAVSEPQARGTMQATADLAREHQRKVRTVLRGMATLKRFYHLLNPIRFPLPALVLWSHKLARWLVPVALIVMMLASLLLAISSTFYLALFAGQLVFYGIAVLERIGVSIPGGRIVAYFVIANAAILQAAWHLLRGERWEIWEPTRRQSGTLQ
jgi:glycosyltransferase involved in cell wall biosynthesis